jgi:hypothetical protein
MAGLAPMALLAGCFVTSVYPFYTAKEEVFDPALLGTWAEAGSTSPVDEYWRFESLNGQAYWLTIIENGTTNRYETHRFRLKQHWFLDLRTTNHHEEQLPLHYLIKIAQGESKLQFTLLNFEWLTTLLQKNPKALRHILVPDEPGNTNNQHWCSRRTRGNYRGSS